MLMVSSGEKRNGLVQFELNRTAWAWPASWTVYLPSRTKARFFAIELWQKVNNDPVPGSWSG